MFSNYDVLIVGGGHAGCEAAIASSNLGCMTLLITMRLNTIGQMSCNPAIGGIAKGQIVREIDAMGGMTGVIADKSTIQFRMLNRSKGPAMWSPRSQNDRLYFAKYWREELEARENIDLWQDNVIELIIRGDKVCGVKTSMGLEIFAEKVILTNGTFLNGIIHVGRNNFTGGRLGDRPSEGITKQLIDLGFESGRLKTGTPPRVDGRSLDYTVMEEQIGDSNYDGFSFLNIPKLLKQRSCFITYTNPEVHKILERGFCDSPMFSGAIGGRGPRYCPSIEDKITRFAERERHQIFVEPEGANTVEVYVNGFSTSLPLDIQHEAIRKIEGFKNAKIIQPGYAIEYDFFTATQLYRTLETKIIKGLYFAGQINGTTGYEEAACQGMVAGINAARSVKKLSEYIFSRTNSYIGVLIDDLTSKETTEPYRMFTSRAEFRLLLRNDNADLRLSPEAFNLGLISQERYDMVLQKQKDIAELKDYLYSEKISQKDFNEKATSLQTTDLKEKSNWAQIILRPEINLSQLASNFETINSACKLYDAKVIEEVEIDIKYKSYIERESEFAKKAKNLETFKIPHNIDYTKIKSLSAEAIEKLNKIKPLTIGHASQISGISPADISILIVYFGR